MTSELLFILAGLGLLFAGGEALVRGSVALAERLGLSKMVIGLTIVGFGTSAPELLVSVQAALSGNPEIALGNVVGSNIANILLIIGVGALILPIAGWQRSAVREALVASLVALALLGFMQGGLLGRAEGGALLLALAVYLGATFWLERQGEATGHFDHEAEERRALPAKSPWLSLLLVVGGIAALVFGADLLVDGATTIARSFGVSDAVIGLTLVAVGTSLPELATSIVAAIRRHSDVVVGNVLGSNIFNVLAILGITAVIAPVEVSARFQGGDTLLMLALSCGFAALLFLLRRIGRPIGAVMVLGYLVYLYLLYAGGAI